MQIKETINYFCEILVFFGNKSIKSEDLRKAKQNDPQPVFFTHSLLFILIILQKLIEDSNASLHISSNLTSYF